MRPSFNRECQHRRPDAALPGRKIASSLRTSPLLSNTNFAPLSNALQLASVLNPLYSDQTPEDRANTLAQIRAMVYDRA